MNEKSIIYKSEIGFTKIDVDIKIFLIKTSDITFDKKIKFIFKN